MQIQKIENGVVTILHRNVKKELRFISRADIQILVTVMYNLGFHEGEIHEKKLTVQRFKKVADQFGI